MTACNPCEPPQAASAGSASARVVQSHPGPEFACASIAHESLPVLHLHAQGSARRRRGQEPPADDARRLRQTPWCRHLQLPADGPARDPQGRGHRARGDEPRRRDRALDAHRAAGRAVAGKRALPGLRAGAAARERPAPARFRDPADERGGGHRHRAPGVAQLPPIAEELLSHPDQVPRRAPAALRPDARARVHDEGRVLIRPRRRRRGEELRDDVARLLRDLRPLRAHLPRRRGRLGRDRRRPVAGVPGHCRHR
jgi:hypothetical protein